MKKLLSILLSVILILMVCPIGVFELPAFAETSGNYTYTVSNGEATITGCSYYYALGSISIPSTLGGYPVTSIGNSAFRGCTGLTSVTIGNSVTSIGFEAFYGCTGLTSVTIPDSVTSIGDSAFYGCTALDSITVDNNNKVYRSENNCIIKKKGNVLVAGCKNSVIPDSVTSIGNYAFYGCVGLSSITIPDSVTSIGNRAFEGCTGLTEVTIPDSVTLIGSSAFYGCTGLTSVTIGNSVTSIGSYAFSGCAGLTGVYITDLNVWYNISFNGSAANPLSYAKKLYLNGDLVTNLVIPDGITSIGSYAFSGCTGLTSISIPDSVTSIGSNAFYGCTGLTSVTIGNSVTSIGEWAFSGCYGLTSITIPDSVTSIGERAFSGCSGLTSITIPDSVTSIGWYAFSGCTGLTSITIPDSVTSIWYAFDGCTGLESIIIPSSVRYISSYAFNNCALLYDVYYTGTQEQKEKIQIGDNNDDIIYATWHCDFKPCKHNSTELKNQKAVSCTEDGYSGDTYCVDCGVKLTDGEIIPKTGHKYVWRITKLATATENGLKEEICSICGEKTGKSQELLYTGHITGDINGDNSVNNKDLTRLFQYLSDWDVEVNEAALDVNGDGAVNNKDLTRLFQYLSDWDVIIY